MKIGILICGEVPDALKQEYGDYGQCLIREFGLTKKDDIHLFNAHNKEVPETVKLCDAYIISGSPSSVYDESKWILDLILFIQEAFDKGKKLLGICFGHQLVNYALGGTVKRSINEWGSANIYKEYLEMQKGQNVSLLSMHQDQVTALANGFEVIAGCDFCANYITRYKNQVLTIQGHPEFSPEFFLALLKETKQKYCDSTMQNALKTLSNLCVYSHNIAVLRESVQKEKYQQKRG